MGIFAKPDPVAAAAQAVADLSARESNLRQRLVLAQNDLSDAVSARRALLVGGDATDQQCAASDTRVSRAEVAVDGLTDAIATLADQRAQAEAELEALRDQADRRAEAERISAVLASARAKCAALDGALHDFAQVFAGIMAVGHGAATSAAQFRARIADLAGQTLQEGEAFRGRLLSGEAPLPRPTLVAAAQPAPAPIEKKKVYSLSPLRWREHGEEKRCPAYAQIDLPAIYIDRAKADNLLEEIGSERYNRVVPIKGSGMGWNPPAADDPRLVDLDLLLYGHVDGRAELFATEALRWSEDGATKNCPRYRTVSLPAAAATRARELGAAKPPSDPEARQLALSYGGTSRAGMGDRVIDLDEPAAASAA
jgi:hypothetical protein